MRSASFRPLVRAAALALVLVAAGCGNDFAGPSGDLPAEVAPGGVLTVALPGNGRSLDPLTAGPAARIVTRQVAEPLVSDYPPRPGRESRPRAGLALRERASFDRREWTLTLRRKVRFQDGSAFSAAAVVANVRRWQQSSAGRKLLPGLIAADAPRSSVVRFVFSRPFPGLPRRLASAQLGILAPAALRQHGATRLSRAGTGPFELRERGAGGELVLASSATWWGRREGLGPSLDQLRFRFGLPAPRRAALLRSGDVQVAAGIGPAIARQVRRSPLLTIGHGTPGPWVASDRSVRGIEPRSDGWVLAGAWLAQSSG